MAEVATMKCYNLSDFEGIINDGFKCELSDEVLKIIQTLADQVGAPEYIKTPQFIRKDKSDAGYRNRRNRRKQKATELSDEAWEEIRNFEATKRVEKEGIDKSIDNVRKAMNKISNKTYDTLKEKIFSELITIVDSGIDVYGEDMTKLVKSLYTIASENSFYSEIYAKLYAELVEKHEFTKKPLLEGASNYISQLKTIKYVSPDDDYDGFCKNNKENANRRAVGVFLVNALKHGLIEADTIVDIIEEIQLQIVNLIGENEQSEIVDELSELVGEILPPAINILLGDEYDSSIRDMVNNIEKISKMKSKDHQSLSNKAVFKHMDILETPEVEEANARLG